MPHATNKTLLLPLVLPDQPTTINSLGGCNKLQQVQVPLPLIQNKLHTPYTYLAFPTNVPHQPKADI
jgi:hypothetical protein